MGGKPDVVKGRIKGAAGVATGNDELRTEGKTDQAVGNRKDGRIRTMEPIADTPTAPESKPGSSFPNPGLAGK